MVQNLPFGIKITSNILIIRHGLVATIVVRQIINEDKFLKTKGKKTNAKFMIFEAKLQEIELIFRIILLNIIHLGI